MGAPKVVDFRCLFRCRAGTGARVRAAQPVHEAVDRSGVDIPGDDFSECFEKLLHLDLLPSRPVYRKRETLVNTEKRMRPKTQPKAASLEFAARMPRIDSNRFSGDMCGGKSP